MLLLDIASAQLIYKLAVVVVVVVLALTLLSLFGNHLYLELTTHFRLQYVIAAFFGTGLLIVFQSGKLIPLGVFCIAFNLACLVPYLSSFRQPDIQTSGLRLRLMQINVLKNNENYKAVLNAIKAANPDVVVVQELTSEWRDNIQVLGDEYPFNEIAARPSGSGMALFSRYPLDDAKILLLDSSSHLVIQARVSLSDASVSILALHPPTPITPGRFANRNRQFAEAARIMAATPGPRIVIGDLNTTMWSPYFIDLEKDSGLRDARLGFGLKTSWPMPLPSFLRLPIDHCLVSNDIAVEKTRIGNRTGSDHLPLIVDVRVGTANDPHATASGTD